MSKKRNITLKDIAKECGVSISTVSKILSGNDNFKTETIDLVFKTAKKMEYAPNLFARTMVTKETNKTVGFFIPNILNPFFSELVNSVEKKLSEHGYLLALCIYDDDAEKMSRFVNLLVEMRVDGMIFAALREDKCTEDFELAKRYTNLVSIQADVDGIDRVDVTDREGTYEMIQYLIDKGHRKIGFIGYGYDMTVHANRKEGYLDALKNNQIKIQKEYLCKGFNSRHSGYQMTKELLSLPDPPTAIHTINEFMAKGATLAIHDLGLSIPGDVSLTTFDGLSISKIMNPPITTISDPVDLLADVAINMLIKRIEEPTDEIPPQHVIIKHSLIERESVKYIK